MEIGDSVGPVPPPGGFFNRLQGLIPLFDHGLRLRGLGKYPFPALAQFELIARQMMDWLTNRCPAFPTTTISAGLRWALVQDQAGPAINPLLHPPSIHHQSFSR
jgi:hypothetical protein